MDVSLETPFLYQNKHTGQPSSAPLTTRQLCRILCPPSNPSSQNSTPTPSTTALISPQTSLLGYDSNSHTYDPQGWKIASTVDVLKESCASWYYEEKENEKDDAKTAVKGPVSARILATLFQNEQVDDKTRVFCYGSVSNGSDDDNSGSSSGEWKSIQDLPQLKLAMEALTESKSMPTSWLAGEATDDGEVAKMTFENGENSTNGDEPSQQQVADDLEAFLSSTDHLAPHANAANEDDDENEEEYESDGGTRYVKDIRTGNWIHEALAPKKEEKSNGKNGQNGNKNAPQSKPSEGSAADVTIPGGKKRKRNKPKFSAKNARNWIYVTGLPKDTNEEEVAAYFSKVGIIDLDPESQKPKVKLYRHKLGAEANDSKESSDAGELKGDASICYARQESVELALQILDENLFRDGAILSVQRAKFEQHGAAFDGDSAFGSKNKKAGRRVVSEAKRKVARLAALQAVGWDEGENGRIAGGLKGLRIIVLMHMFHPSDLENDRNDEKIHSLEKEIHSECEEFGNVEKITIFSKHPAGVIIVKFTQPTAASEAVNEFNGKMKKYFDKARKVEASFWDGVTDYTVRDLEKEKIDTEKRLDEFGDWLENQELPEEFRLRVDGDGKE